MDNVSETDRTHAGACHDADWTAKQQGLTRQRLDVKEKPVSTVAHTPHEADPISQRQELHQTTYDDMST